MSTTIDPASARSRFGAVCLAVSGVLFLLYPVVRPYADETTPAGLLAMASSQWLIAHIAAFIGFILLAVSIQELHKIVRTYQSAVAATSVWIGVAVQMTFYGMETFALNVLGSYADRVPAQDLIEMVEQMRFGAIGFISNFSILVPIGLIVATIAVARSRAISRWSVLPLAVMMVLFIPALFGTPEIRMAHGALVMLASWYLAMAMWRGRQSEIDRESRSETPLGQELRPTNSSVSGR